MANRHSEHMIPVAGKNFINAILTRSITFQIIQVIWGVVVVSASSNINEAQTWKFIGMKTFPAQTWVISPNKSESHIWRFVRYD